MRQWYKYHVDASKDATALFDGKSSKERVYMGGYKADRGYESKEDFFNQYYNHNPRYRLYTDFVVKNISKDKEGLSIASGRCVNELYLKEQGYKIICSDLEHYCKEQTLKLFPDVKFVVYNVSQKPFERRVDYVLAFSLLYLFNRDELLNIFKNVAGSLVSGGQFIVDPGGAEDNSLTFFIDEILCKYETRLKAWRNQFLNKEPHRFVRKVYGYRSTNQEIIAIAEKAGFKLAEHYESDSLSELKGRSLMFKPFPDACVATLGKQAPYVRLFRFIKEG